MNPLLRVALAFCPLEFRAEYESQILADAQDAKWRGPSPFAAGITVLIGLLQALRLPRDARSGKRLSSTFVAAEVALAIALMMSTGLLVRSFVALVPFFCVRRTEK